MTTAIEASMGLIIGSLSIIATVITAITFFNKLRWEIETLKRENESRGRKIEAVELEVRMLSEKGSIPTVSLEKKVTELEKKFEGLKSDLMEMKIDIKAILRCSSTGGDR